MQREKEELEGTVRRLEEKLRVVHTAEKPLEDTESDDEAGKQSTKAIQNAEEVARWEERKKWEGKVQALKAKLDEANEMVAKLSRTNESLRVMSTRVEREKVAQENKVKALQKAMQVSCATFSCCVVLRRTWLLNFDITSGQRREVDISFVRVKARG